VIDNTFARFKWQAVLRTTWLAAASLVFINLIILSWVL
jgi:hypothetical protein